MLGLGDVGDAARAGARAQHKSSLSRRPISLILELFSHNTIQSGSVDPYALDPKPGMCCAVLSPSVAGSVLA